MLSVFDGLRDVTTLSVFVRLACALICGGIIGIERSYKRRPAGFRTHILICIGAAITTLFDMLGNASDLTIINTGKVYVLYDDFGKLCLKPYESLLLPLYIDEDTAQGYSYTSSIDSDVYNRIKLAWDNDETGVREVHVMNNTASQSKWGTLQYYEKLDNALNTADLQTKAKALMKYYNVIHRELTMQKVFGDVRARAGTSVCVGMGLGDINIKNYMCVEKAKHTFSNGLYTMDLYLSGIRGEFSA